MSDQAILRGLETFIRDNLTDWNDQNCEARPDESPIPLAPDSFLAIHLTETQFTNSTDRSTTEIRGVGLTIIHKINSVPESEIVGSIYLQQTTGMASKMLRLRSLILGRNYQLMQAIQTEANNILAADPELNSIVDCINVNTPFYAMNRTSKLIYGDEIFAHGYTKHNTDERDGLTNLRMTLYLTGLQIETVYTPQICPQP